MDSSAAAVLLSNAVGAQLTCVFVDHGFLRKNEGEEVEAVFGPEGHYDLNFRRVNAQERFYKKLRGVEDPEQKRKIIGEEFIRVFEDERTYDYAVALRAVHTIDFMTAEAVELPWEVLEKVTGRIVNEVKFVKRVLYDCTGKPPGTIVGNKPFRYSRRLLLLLNMQGQFP